MEAQLLDSNLTQSHSVSVSVSLSLSLSLFLSQLFSHFMFETSSKLLPAFPK